MLENEVVLREEQDTRPRGHVCITICRIESDVGRIGGIEHQNVMDVKKSLSKCLADMDSALQATSTSRILAYGTFGTSDRSKVVVPRDDI